MSTTTIGTPVYSDECTLVTVLKANGVDMTRPVTPVEADSLRAIEAAGQEANAAYGTPAFGTMAQHFHRLVQRHRETFGLEPRPTHSVAEYVSTEPVQLSCGHMLTTKLETPECVPGCCY